VLEKFRFPKFNPAKVTKTPLVGVFVGCQRVTTAESNVNAKYAVPTIVDKDNATEATCASNARACQQTAEDADVQVAVLHD
jgi:hypothetical protein